jgi:uncharacterized membrane protein YkoI
MTRVRPLVAALVLSLTAAAGAQAQARDWLVSRMDNAAPQTVQARVLTVREVIAIVRSQRGGDCVDVRAGPIQSGDGLVYVLRWRYPNGAEEDLRVDAVSGRVLGR